MEYEFADLENKNKVVIISDDYILTTNGMVLKKKKNGKYVQVNDKTARMLIELTKSPDKLMTFQKENFEIDER